MSFQAFAASHGLIINDLQIGKWTRVPTTDHPHKRNGAYFYEGDSGAVQNWAMHTKPISWRSSSPVWIDMASIKKRRDKIQKEREQAAERAAKKAGWIMHSTIKATHPYLAKKGLPNERVWVWNNLMVVPMRVDNRLVGCQLISEDGDKKFLTGQITKNAVAVFDNKGVPILCEGYATALSVRRALKAVKTRYKLIVCFSAGNITTVAKNIPDALVVADNDATGIKVAKDSGKPYWVSDVEGEDFNDAEVRVGAQAAGKWLLEAFGGRILSED
jgi:putative DNA primase/helicase